MHMYRSRRLFRNVGPGKRQLVYYVLGPALPSVAVLFAIRQVEGAAGAAQKVNFFRLGVHVKSRSVAHVHLHIGRQWSKRIVSIREIKLHKRLLKMKQKKTLI